MTTRTFTPEIIRTRTTVEPIPLPAPDIAVAFHDDDSRGLIPVSELGAPLKLDLKVWDAAEPGYTYNLYWNGTDYPPIKVISATDKPGDPIFLDIPADLLSEGLHSAQYRTYSRPADSSNYSETFPVIVDRTAPGKPLLAAIQFPVEVQNGLTAAELTELGGKLEVMVAGYTGMMKHDVIKTFWGSIEGPTAVVDETDMGLNKVVFDFSAAFLQSISSGTHSVKYHVVDRAGNISDQSLAVDIVLMLEEVPDNYPAPVLDPGLGTLIDYAEAKPGVRVDIPRYLGATAYDQITLFWGDSLAMLPVQLPPGNENDDVILSLRVPYETIAVNPVGAISISYEVRRQNQLNGSSLPALIDVHITLPIPEGVTALTVQGTSDENSNTSDNFIDEDDYELNARAIIRWHPSFQVSDTLSLNWGDQMVSNWYQVRATDVAQQNNLIIPIDNTAIKTQGTGAQIPVRYRVTRLGNPNPSSSPIQNVTVRSKENLPGGQDGVDGPTFRLNPAGYISQSVAPDGTYGHIDAYANIMLGQKLYFTFKGFDRENNPIDSATFNASRILDDQDISNGYDFKVPFNTLRTICRGFCEAYIRIEPAPGSNQSSVTSRTTRVPVEMRESIEADCRI